MNANQMSGQKIKDDKAINKKQKIIANGVLYAELNHFFSQILSQDGYSGMQQQNTRESAKFILKATRTKEIIGYNSQRINMLNSAIQKRLNRKEGQVELYVEKITNRGLCAASQAESVKYKLAAGLAPRRSCFAVIRQIMENGALGAQILVSGKTRGQRAKTMKFSDGMMVHSGQPAKDFVRTAVAHVPTKSGILGVKVKIMLGYDKTGKRGYPRRLPDTVIVRDPITHDTRETNLSQPKENFQQSNQKDGNETQQQIQREPEQPQHDVV